MAHANIAAKKAYGLLYDRVTNATLLSPRKKTLEEKSVQISDKSVVSSIPSASLLSESVALACLLEEAETQGIGGHPFTKRRTLVSLQESLLLDPTNVMAATSLGLNGQQATVR